MPHRLKNGVKSFDNFIVGNIYKLHIKLNSVMYSFLSAEDRDIVRYAKLTGIQLFKKKHTCVLHFSTDGEEKLIWVNTKTMEQSYNKAYYDLLCVVEDEQCTNTITSKVQ